MNLFHKEVEVGIEIALTILPSRTAQILRLRFGFDGDAKILSEIGAMFNISGQQVRNIEGAGLRKIKKELSEKMREYLDTINGVD